MSAKWKPARSQLEEGVEGLHLSDIKEDTKSVSTKLQMRGPPPKPLILPIYHSSTFKASVKDYLEILNSAGYIYTRLSNPNCEQVECTVNALEEGAGTLTFSSGMAALTTAVLGVCKAGDHIIAQTPIYSGTQRFLAGYGPDYGFECTFVPAGCSVDEYRKHVKPNTKLLIGETPANPDISVLDIEELAKLSQSLKDCYTMVDSTYATPYCQQPIKYGIDMVVHSATKFLGGHSDLVAGVLTTRKEELWVKLNMLRTTLGNTLSPFEANSLHKGLKTLHVRMERHCFNAERVAEFLSNDPRVGVVHYPGLASHPAHELAKKQMKRYGGMIAFDMKGGLEAAQTLVESVRVIQFAVSLGGVESLIEHPATMTHGPMLMSDADRAEARVTPGLVRLSVGLEHIDDLIKDLQYALDKVPVP